MTYKAIPIEGYYIIVDSKDVTLLGKITYMSDPIAQSQNVLPGVPLFDAPWEEDVEKLARKAANERLAPKELHECTSVETFVQVIAYDFYKIGYNAAKAKYEFTREDIEKAVTRAIYSGYYHKDIRDKKITEIIQSLQKPKSYEVQIEEEEYIVSKGLVDIVDYRPKITNNKITITSWKEI